MNELPKAPGLFARLILRWSEKRQRQELSNFLGVLSTLNDDEMSELLLCVAHIRHGMEAQGIKPLEPFQVVIKHPAATIEMARMSQQFNRTKAYIPAAACTVWGHTFRASLNTALHPQARLLWGELKRGDKGLLLAKIGIAARYGIEISAEDAHLVPATFEIRP